MESVRILSQIINKLLALATEESRECGEQEDPSDDIGSFLRSKILAAHSEVSI